MSVAFRIRAWPRAAATGAAIAVFLAGGNSGAPHHDGTNHYQAGVIADPRFEASVSFTDDGWAAQAVPSVGAIGWAPAEPAKLDQFTVLYWRDATIEVDRIKDGVVTRRLTGTIAEATVSDGKLIITCADLSKILDKPVTAATFAGTGGIEGGDFAIGRAKRRSFGRVWNVEGRLLDKVNNIYEFGDPAFPLQGCTALRDMGRAGPLGIIAWQGSIAATLNALKAATPERGGGLFAPSIGCAKWWTQPAGPLTADLLGEAAGYSETAAGIAAQLLGLAQGPTISNLAAANALRPAVCGLHIGDNSETTSAALDRLLQRVTLGWRLTPAGAVEIWNYTFTGPVETLNATFISRESTIQPVKSRQVGYKKNERVHGDGEISAAVQASDVVYEDGTTAEDWKPADKGATNGASAAEKDQLAQLEADTATAKTNIAAAQAQIAAIQSSVATDFSAVNAEVDALQSSLSTAQGNITSLQSSVNASLSALNSDVDALETQAAGIISSVTGLGDEITALGDDVATLESTVSAHGSSIGQNAIAIAGLSGNLATLTTRVNAGGNTNLIPGLESGFAGWSAASFNLIVSGGWGLVASRTADSNQLIFLDSPPAPVFPTRAYTAAADSVLQIAGGTGSARVEILFKNSAGEIIGNPQSGSRSANHDFTNDGSSRAILTATGIAPANAVTATVRLTAQKNSGTLTVVGWRQVKLEQGSVATPYSFDASVYQQFQAISTLDVGFASLTTTVGAQGSIITQNSQAISGLQGSLSSLSSDVSVHGANISSLQQASTSQAGQLAQHTTDIATANSNISINAQAINTANGSLAGLTTRVGTAESSITSLQSASTTQAGQISTLQSTVATQGSSISSNATAITTLQGNVASLTTRVNAAQTNLLPNGGLENGFAGAISDGGFTYGNWGTWGPNAYTSTNGQHVFQFGDIMQVQVGATYWISCDPLALGGSDICCDLLFLDASGNVLLDGGQNAQSGPFNYSTDDTRRGLIAVSAVAPSGTTRIRARIIGNVVSGATIGFRRVKVEMGANWTGFSSEASIVQSFTAYSGLDSSLATLSSTVSTQGGSITSLQSSFTSLNGTVSSLSSTVSAQGTSISTLQSASSTQAGQIASLSTRVNASQANLLRNGGLENGFSGATSTAGFGWFSSPSWGPAASTTTNGTQVFQFADIEAAQVGETYWISCDPLAFGTSSIYCDLLFLNAAGSVILDGPQNSQNGEFNFSGDNTRRGLIAVSAVAPPGTVKIRPRIVANVVGGQVAGFRRVKVETGTSWTPFSSEASVVQSFEAISTLNSSYASLSSTVSTQGATISSQATAISTLQGQQSSLSSTVSAQGASITSLQTTTATLQGNVATLTTRVSASGANLLPNGGLENGFNSGIASTGGFQFSASNDWGPIALSYDNGLHVFTFAPVYNPQVGGAYTFSVDPLQFGTSDVYCDIICQDVNGNVLLDGVEHGISGQFNFDNTDTRRGQMACTVSSVPSGTDRLICRVFGTVRDGQPIGFRRAKLENGTVWSRYSAEATAAQQFQTLSTLTTQYASLSSTVSTQGVTISTQATAISTLQSNVTSLFAKWSLELDVNGYVSGMVTNNNGTRADLTLRMDKVKMVTPSGLGGYWQVIFDGQGRPTQTIGDDASGVMIEVGYLA